jgi:hypothetical protein
MVTSLVLRIPELSWSLAMESLVRTAIGYRRWPMVEEV